MSDHALHVHHHWINTYFGWVFFRYISHHLIFKQPRVGYRFSFLSSHAIMCNEDHEGGSHELP
jgi:hypothetical protein